MFAPRTFLSFLLVLTVQMSCDVWCMAGHCPDKRERDARSSDTAACHQSQPVQENSKHNQNQNDCGHQAYFDKAPTQISKVIHLDHTAEGLSSPSASYVILVSERLQDATSFDCPLSINTTILFLRI